jgi:hypothetical protein
MDNVDSVPYTEVWQHIVTGLCYLVRYDEDGIMLYAQGPMACALANSLAYIEWSGDYATADMLMTYEDMYRKI